MPIRLFNVEVQRKTFGVPDNYIIKTESVQAHVISRSISVERMLLKASLVHQDDLIPMQPNQIRVFMNGIKWETEGRYYLNHCAGPVVLSRAVFLDLPFSFVFPRFGHKFGDGICKFGSRYITRWKIKYFNEGVWMLLSHVTDTVFDEQIFLAIESITANLVRHLVLDATA